MSSRHEEPCDATIGEHHGELHFYVNGWKCDAHSPWAMAKQAAPQPGYGLPPKSLPPSPLAASAVFDQKAIANSKRRSSPEAYKAAKTAVAHRKAT
ncbi:hypothetical protein OG478_22985 [Streptomyces phaeochromogenes]|uniref:hypothetical protein n=1 Tax=Streptomyces phaeochromogenes TaxID=1923 RepID=UPI003863AA9C|nr:hypothetical protein OG478_22985 [Streptomyces phaeochromogenes]